LGYVTHKIVFEMTYSVEWNVKPYYAIPHDTWKTLMMMMMIPMVM